MFSNFMIIHASNRISKRKQHTRYFKILCKSIFEVIAVQTDGSRSFNGNLRTEEHIMIKLNKRGEKKRRREGETWAFPLLDRILNEEKEFHVKVDMNGHCVFVLGTNMFSPRTSNAINIII